MEPVTVSLPAIQAMAQDTKLHIHTHYRTERGESCLSVWSLSKLARELLEALSRVDKLTRQRSKLFRITNGYRLTNQGLQELLVKIAASADNPEDVRALCQAGSRLKPSVTE
jgi:DNA invertase Pin-like site-specific DNA recombinase